MENKSGLRPLGVAVLLKPYEPERKGAIIALPDAVRDRVAMVDNRAIVVEVGQSCWHDEPAPRAKAGDKVLVTKFAGFSAKGEDGETYRLVNDRDIFCALVGESHV